MRHDRLAAVAEIRGGVDRQGTQSAKGCANRERHPAGGSLPLGFETMHGGFQICAWHFGN